MLISDCCLAGASSQRLMRLKNVVLVLAESDDLCLSDLVSIPIATQNTGPHCSTSYFVLMTYRDLYVYKGASGGSIM